jgi:hypothetical protein
MGAKRALQSLRFSEQAPGNRSLAQDGSSELITDHIFGQWASALSDIAILRRKGFDL